MVGLIPEAAEVVQAEQVVHQVLEAQALLYSKSLIQSQQHSQVV